jgi:iron complex outermembrane receptor protein
MLFATAMGCGAAAPAFAQTDAGAGRTLDDIIVTARRVEERLQDVPISITVFNQEQLANRNIYNGTELATYTPSLQSNTRFGAERSSFAIRGFTQEIGTAPSVAVYFGDVIAPRAASIATSGNGAGPGAYFDLQNVQVLKGPQGTLFGRNTTGGAILMVPKKPVDRFESYIEGSIGNFDMRRIQGVLNLPITDNVRVRLGIDRNTRDGYLKNVSGVGPKDFNDTDYVSLRASLVADLTPDIENYTIATYSKSDTNGNHLRLLNCNRARTDELGRLGCANFDRQLARGKYTVESPIANPYQRLTQWQVINTTTWRVNEQLTVKNIASYGEFRDATNNNFVGDSLLRPGDTAGGPYAFIVVTPGLDGYLTNQRTYTEELQFQGRGFDDKLDWQAGAYLEISNPIDPASQYQAVSLRCRDVTRFQCDPLNATSSVTLPNQGLDFRNYAFYAQGSYDLTDQLRLTAGVRYTNDRVKAKAENVQAVFTGPNTVRLFCASIPTIVLTNVGQKGLCHQEFEAKSDKPTWLINLDYKPNDDVLLYAKYARGYRAGGINPSVTLFESWGPEKVDSYEVGAKTNFDGAVRGSFNLAGFYNDFTDQQLQTSLFTPVRPVSAILNVGKSRIWGVELEGVIEPVEGLRFEGNYTYLNTKVVDIVAPTLDPRFYTGFALTTLKGDPLILSPKHKFTLTGSYTLPLDEHIGEVTFGATYAWTDKMLATRASPILDTQILPSVGILNLNLNWNSVYGAPVDVSFFVTNLTKEYVRTYVSAGYNSSGFDSGVFSEPRMYGMRVRYHFGE